MARYLLLSLLTLLSYGAEVVAFPSGKLTLHGVLYRPEGPGPFPAVVFNHGSGKSYTKQIEALGPVFTARGWVFFAPYRRGQGLSAAAGPYIVAEMDAAQKKGGARARSETMIRLLETDHLEDQLAGLAWLKNTGYVVPDRIAVQGNSFGGIQTVLGAARASYCAAIDSAGAAQTWSESPEVQALMKRSVRDARIPILFLQAENDYDLGPSKTLSAEMKQAGKPYEIKIYPPFGKTKEEGHSFGYFGGAIWGDDVFGFLERHCGSRRN